jgi:hypothetical protein
MDISPALKPGSVKGIDHVTFGYPRGAEPIAAIRFFASLGVAVVRREEDRLIDDFLPGPRFDFRVGQTTVTFAPGQRRSLWPSMVLRRFARHPSHVAFLISPRDFDELLDHPRVDYSLGDEGRVRWGTGDWSVFMHGPYALRFEFRCPNAHHFEP